LARFGEVEAISPRRAVEGELHPLRPSGVSCEYEAYRRVFLGDRSP
jgi:hypothetical protein